MYELLKSLIELAQEISQSQEAMEAARICASPIMKMVQENLKISNDIVRMHEKMSIPEPLKEVSNQINELVRLKYAVDSSSNEDVSLTDDDNLADDISCALREIDDSMERLKSAKSEDLENECIAKVFMIIDGLATFLYSQAPKGDFSDQAFAFVMALYAYSILLVVGVYKEKELERTKR